MKKFFYLALFCLTIMACDQKIEQITVKGADGKEYTSYQSACSSGDFDAAREYIAQMKNQMMDADAAGSRGYEKYKALKEMIPKAEAYVFNEEIQYLASLNEDQANNKVILILNQQSIDGLEAAEGACLGKDIYEHHLDVDIDSYRNDSPEEVRNYRKYISWCGAHNSKCNNILGVAIGCGNQKLASKILHLFRNDPELKLIETRDDRGSKYYDVYAHYTNSSIDAARKKYDEAVKSGAFN